jgi:argonaute-like protein implicated in RNA metabolism and viral defense
MLTRTENSALVWVAGNAPTAGLGDPLYHQGAKSIPKPLNIIRHAGRGPLEVVALETVALTTMDWNNDALYDPVPVTIRYSQKLAKTIVNVPSLPGHHYPYRMFI